MNKPRIYAGISVAIFAAWLWLDAILTVLERTGQL